MSSIRIDDLAPEPRQLDSSELVRVLGGTQAVDQASYLIGHSGGQSSAPLPGDTPYEFQGGRYSGEYTYEETPSQYTAVPLTLDFELLDD